MEITLPLTSILIIAIGSTGIGVSIYMGTVFIIKNKNKHISTSIFTLLLFLTGLTLLHEVLATSGITSRFPFLYYTPTLFSLSIAPLFYLFIKSRIKQSLSVFDGLHLVIPVIQFLGYLSIGFRSVSYKYDLWRNPTFKALMDIESALFSVSLICYGALSLYLLHKPKQHMHFWQEDQLSWLRSVAKVFLAIAAMESADFIGKLIVGHRFGELFYLLRISFFVAIVLWIAYHAIKVLNPDTIYMTTPERTNSLLSTSESTALKQELARLFEEDKIHLNSDLNLRILAEYLGTTEKKCSNLISTEMGSNFNQYVNSWRITEFKKKVMDEKHKSFTLLSLAYECGFQSKSTFNRAFKMLNGVSPREYVNSLK